MSIDKKINSFKFWDIVNLWARERLEHEFVVSTELIKGVIQEGLRFQSYDPKWMLPNEEFKRYPYIGYSSSNDKKPIILKAKVLEHMLSVMHNGTEPSNIIINEEYISKADFKQWLVRKGKSFPEFWYDTT